MKLKTMHEEWIKKQFKSLRTLLCPYKNRIPASAWHRRWLKGTMKKNRTTRWLNYIDCESHHDILRVFLHEYI